MNFDTVNSSVGHYNDGVVDNSSSGSTFTFNSTLNILIQHSTLILAAWMGWVGSTTGMTIAST